MVSEVAPFPFLSFPPYRPTCWDLSLITVTEGVVPFFLLLPLFTALERLSQNLDETRRRPLPFFSLAHDQLSGPSASTSPPPFPFSPPPPSGGGFAEAFLAEKGPSRFPPPPPFFLPPPGLRLVQAFEKLWYQARPFSPFPSSRAWPAR